MRRNKTFDQCRTEEILRMDFPEREVLQKDDDRKVRGYVISFATHLGKAYNFPVRIEYETWENTFSIEDTVIEATEDNVKLKGGLNIPIRRIRDIWIY